MAFSCVLIGDASLTHTCGQLLLDAGHRLAAVVTRDGAVRQWAIDRGLAVLDRADAAELSHLGPFDHLLSIVNLRMLDEAVLALPSGHAINFHDGPLPRFAGLNAPVWALLEGADEFGVTWHLMTAEADTGDIIEQELFPIEPGETALSLNTRCFEAGIESFRRLISRLDSGCVVAQPQDLSLRTYHGAGRRPALAGVIDFSLPWAEIDRLARALDFGDYPNPVCTLKLATSRGYVNVRRATLAGPPADGHGIIGQVTSHEIVVSHREGQLHLTGFTNQQGSPLSATGAAEALGVKPGDALTGSSADPAAIAAAAEASARDEPRIRRLLAEAKSSVLPLLVQAQAGPREPVCVTLPGKIDRAEAAALAGLFLSRLAGTPVTLSLSTESRAELCERTAGLFSPWVPFVADARAEDPRRGAAAAVARATGAPPVASDLVARTPDLQSGHAGDSLAVSLGPVPVNHGFQLLLQLAGSEATWHFDPARFGREDVETLAAGFAAFVEAAAASPAAVTRSLPLLGAHSLIRLENWNATATPFDGTATVPTKFEARVALQPGTTALVAGQRSLTYDELNREANQLAAHLRELGVRRESLVAIHLERSAEMVVAMLAILKAGGAYVPVDPGYPETRKQLMLEDSGARVVITTSSLSAGIAGDGRRVVLLDGEPARALPCTNPEPVATGDSLAYVIYTSGSTGRPKGVMVEHRNVINFFAGMDQRMGPEPGTWLAETSPSFDISVLELLWTLTRGFTVVLDRVADAVAPSPTFSLYFFSSSPGEGTNAYGLLMEASKFADEHGFEAVWTPERHFHAFGGAFPNPSVTSAAIAATTRNVKIRAGSCVLPLHSPIRVAEEWAVVDNISGGRVGVSFAAGWQPDDFVLKPESYSAARDVMVRDLTVVQALWRGESHPFRGVDGKQVEVHTLPRPVQRELPTWLTSAGDPETFRLAGRLGVNMLTHLLGQTMAEVAEKVRIYREAWQESGHDGRGQVTLMLHTFIGDNEATVKDLVREPMIAYLASSVGLVKHVAASFPAFKRLPEGEDPSQLLESLSAAELRELLEVAFERYYETSGLFGTVQSALPMVRAVHEAGVDELACLVDFGVAHADVMAGLSRIDELKRRARETEDEPRTSGDLILQHGVTHLQCTPSMARMLLADPATKEALRAVHTVMIGGEAFPADLARDLNEAVGGRVLNMYGPTETTIWSTTHEVAIGESAIPIGTPIANTAVYILDADRQLLPPGLTGELWIGGEGVTRGYLGRPELTADRFAQDPFAMAPGERMYRTGDLARWRSNGTIEFLGRVDQQVKVRGYRIEPAEIEAAMQAVAGVREACVIAREDQPGDQRLVGYYVSQVEGADRGPDLRRALATALPEYMVPTHFVRLDALPLTPNAKVDRKALPAPAAHRVEGHLTADPSAPSRVAVAVAPASATELALVSSTWEGVLNMRPVAHDRTFFDLGGNSLLLLQVHKRLAAHHPTLRLTDLFKHPTVSALASHLSSNRVSTTPTDNSNQRANARRSAMGRRLG